jgi:hypothetical protein
MINLNYDKDIKFFFYTYKRKLKQYKEMETEIFTL